MVEPAAPKAMFSDLVLEDSPWVDVRAYGAETTATAAVNNAAIQAALDNGNNVYIPYGTYQISANLYKFASFGMIRIFGEGTLDSSAAAAGSLTVGGTTGSSAPLGADVIEGAVALTCALSVSTGDIIRILSTDSFSPASASMVKGELAEVLSSSGGVITLKSHLYSAYSASTTTITKINMPKVTIDGITIKRNADNGAGLQVQYARDLTINNVKVSGARDRGIYIEEIYGGIVSGCDVSDAWVDGGGTQYSFVLGSSQNVTVSGNRFMSGRHGVANGGTFPFRAISYIGNVVDNKHGIGQYSFDTHSNGDHIIIVGNTILNGLDIESGNTIVANNTIRSDDFVYGTMFNLYRNTKYLIFSDNSSVNWVASGNAVTVTTSGTDNISVERLSLEGNYLASNAADIYITTGDNVILTVRDFSIKNNTVCGGGGYSLAVYPGTASSVAGTFNVSGNYLYSARGAHLLFNGDLSFSRNMVIATTNEGYLFDHIGTGDSSVEGNTFDGSGVSYGVQFENIGTAKLLNNTIKNTGAIPVKTTSDVSLFLESGNIYSGNSGSRIISSTQNISGTFGTGYVGRGASAPAAGTWAVGDIIFNTGADAVVLWKCTVAGTPGTWASH